MQHYHNKIHEQAKRGRFNWAETIMLNVGDPKGQERLLYIMTGEQITEAVETLMAEGFWVEYTPYELGKHNPFRQIIVSWEE